MRQLLDILFTQAKNPGLKEVIDFLQHRPLFWINPDTRKFQPIAANVFTYIGNMAQDVGETDTTRMAREMRDEVKGLCEEEMYDKEHYVEYKR